MAIQRLRELEVEMKKCFRCNMCKMVPLATVRHPRFSDGCPASREFNFHGYSGSGKQIMGLSLVDNRIRVDENLAQIVYACTACGLCDVSCKFIMEAERHTVNMALREHIVDEGFGLAVHAQTVDNIQRHGHPDGRPRYSAGHWAKDLGLAILPKDRAEVLLYAGCLTRDDDQSAATVRKLAQILLQAGVNFGILGDQETSCGLPAYWTGHRDAFTKTAKSNLALLNTLGVKTIVTASGSCHGALQSKYPEYAGTTKARVMHAAEFIWELIEDGALKLKRPIRKKVTYHDPCYLGRQSEPPVVWRGTVGCAYNCMTVTKPHKPINYGTKGVYDAPRRVLARIPGLDFREMWRIREYAYCCGGGGGVPKAYPGFAKATALHRLEEARDVGAEMLVTACHQCRAQFIRAQDASVNARVPITDLIDLVHFSADIME